MTRYTVRDLITAGTLRVEDGNHGNDRPRPHEFIDGGVAFIRAADMTSGVVDFRRAGKISDVARRRIRKGVGEPGDAILSHKGTVGRVAIAPADSPEYVCSPQTTFWRSTNPKILSQKYLAFILKSPGFQKQLKMLAGQTDMAPYASLTDQRSMSIDVPPLEHQTAVAEVLGALDDKIVNQQRVVAGANALADVQFNVRLGEAGVPLSSLARFVNGKAFTKDATGTGRVVVRIAELNSGIGGSTVYNNIDVPDEHLARPGDLLFAWSGSLTVARWYRSEAIVNQHIFKVIPNDGVPMWLVNQAVRSKLGEFKAIAADKATTMGHIQRRHLDELVAVPRADEIQRIDGLMTSLWDVALAAEVASLKAAQTRDELLPLLMSDRIRIRDAERQVEYVV